MRTALVAAILLLPALAAAHDLEKTQVTIAIARDGTFVVDVKNDPGWLLLRLEPFAGGGVRPNTSETERDRRLAQLTSVFVDRVVLFVGQHEVRPESAEYVALAAVTFSVPLTEQARGAGPIAQRLSPVSPSTLASFRLHGHIPAGARTLRWFYGLVIDPYPLTVRFADNASKTLIVFGEAWSEPIALPEPTRATRTEIAALLCFAGLLFALRVHSRRRHRLRT